MVKGAATASMLAGTAGYVNAVAYLGLHAFVAPMTGTVIATGFALSDGNWTEAGHELMVIGAFTAGVVMARLLRRFGWGGAPGWLLSAGILAASAFRPLEGLVSLIPIAASIGCLNGSQTVFGPTTLNTTFITGNLERIGEALVDPGFQNRRKQLALIGLILLVYMAGATAGARAVKHLALPLLAPAGLLLAVGLAGLARQAAQSAARPPEDAV